ncbi:AfsR/SARP family transcriptional regulator [Streptomyces varsoviensis]|nr:AfsR/SARP family transcriptional regulator [Streptomyces varsoviensis]
MGDTVRFFMLGAVRISHSGTDIPAGPPQQQAMLAALLLRSGRAASLHELMSMVWGEQCPDSAATVLRTYAWRLRQRLRAHDSIPEILLSTGSGYRLTVPAGDIDACRAEQLAVEAGRSRAAGRPEECARLLAEAVGLWCGEPLANVPGPFAEQQRRRLVELRLMLLEEQFDNDLSLGRHAAVVPDLFAFTDENPLRERPYGFLMEALYHCARQGEALAVYARARKLLDEELGIQPGPELRALHQHILTNDLPERTAPRASAPAAPAPPTAGSAALAPLASAPAAASPTLPAVPENAAVAESVAHVLDRPPAPAAPAPSDSPRRPSPAQLPPDISDFSGRDGAVARLSEALRETDRQALTVVSVSGMGGIGKSTLVLRVAHRVKAHYPDGQLYADLRGSSTEPADPAAVLASFLAALGVPGPDIPPSPEDRTRLLRTVLDGRRLLVLLDDAKDAAQVRPLLPGSSQCAVVVTSRGRLGGLPATAHIHLDVFETDEALALLRRLIGADRTGEEPAAAAELIAACANLPLAVRIAATRLAARPGWTLASMVGRLHDEQRRLAELRTGDLAVTAIFQLSYGQLPAGQARAFRMLAPVVGPGIALGAAAAALGLPEPEAESLLEGLVDTALLESPAADRYRYHPLVRAFAQRLPAPADEDPGHPLGRLLDHWLAVASSAFQQMVPGDPVHTVFTAGDGRGPRFTDLAAARDWVIEEYDSVLHVILLTARRGPHAPVLLDRAADLLIALSPFGRYIPPTRLAAAARAVAERTVAAGADRAAGRALFVCGNAALQTTRLKEAGAYTRRAAEASRRAGDVVILRQTLNDLGVIALFEHRYEDAVRHFDQVRDTARDMGHRSGELTAVLNGAMARLRGGRCAEAVTACDETLVLLRGVDDQRGIAHALGIRALAQHECGRYAAALSDHQECLSICVRWGFPGQEAQARYRGAATLHALGEHDRARAETLLALAHYESHTGSDWDHGHALLTLARIELDRGGHDEAATRAAEAYALFTRSGLPDVARAADLLHQARSRSGDRP